MLGKLLKYEVKATARTFLPLYLAMIVLAFVNKMFFSLDFEYGTLIAMIALVGVFVALVVVTFVLMITRFYKNLLADEGYLMFTLPVNVDQLIWSKLLVTLLWMVISCVVAVVAFAIMAWQSALPLQELFDAMRLAFREVVEGEFLNVLIQFIIAMILSTLGSIMMLYASMAIGQLPPFSNNRIAAAVVAYILLNIVTNIVSVVIIALMGFNQLDNVRLGELFLIWSNVISLIETVALYICTRIILKKHLNLA